MDDINWLVLNEQYKQLKDKENNGVFGLEDALNLAKVCIELDKRGYLLSEDESTWLEPKDNG